MGRVAILCSGQGSQKPGMAAAFSGRPELDEVFEAASDVCGFDVRAACEDEAALADALKVQPALYAASIAAARAAEAEGAAPDAVAGFSLGQVAALNVAGMLSLEDTFALCAARARAMAEASAATPGAMCALMGADDESVGALIEDASHGAVLVAANYNAPGQIVVSGERDAVVRAAEAWRGPGRRSSMLAVAGAFHSPLMQPAADALASFLEGMRFDDPRIPLVCNVDARPLRAAEAADHMVRQVISPVLFDRSVAALREAGVDTYAECGSGAVLCGLVRRTHKEAARFRIESIDDARALAAQRDAARQ